MAGVRLEDRLKFGAVAFVNEQVEVVVPWNEAVVPVRAEQCTGVEHVVHACLFERSEHQRQQLERYGAVCSIFSTHVMFLFSLRVVNFVKHEDPKLVEDAEEEKILVVEIVFDVVLAAMVFVVFVIIVEVKKDLECELQLRLTRFS